MQESADCLTAFFRGEETEDAETGALVLADAFDQLRTIRISLSSSR